MRKITREQANAAYDILVKNCRAKNDDGLRFGFVSAVAHLVHPADKYRFQGSLGFGGKFRNNGNRDDVPHVDCYPKDETPARLKAVEATSSTFLLSLRNGIYNQITAALKLTNEDDIRNWLAERKIHRRQIRKMWKHHCDADWEAMRAATDVPEEQS